MRICFSPNFDRQFAQRLTKQQQVQVLDAIEQFIDNSNHEDLRNHPLKGNWAGHRSLSIGGDLRLHFQMLDGDTAYFVAVGSHEQLYQ